MGTVPSRDVEMVFFIFPLECHPHLFSGEIILQSRTGEVYAIYNFQGENLTFSNIVDSLPIHSKIYFQIPKFLEKMRSFSKKVSILENFYPFVKFR